MLGMGVRAVNLFIEFWPQITFAGGLIVWLVRLEARALANTKEIQRLWLRDPLRGAK